MSNPRKIINKMFDQDAFSQWLGIKIVEVSDVDPRVSKFYLKLIQSKKIVNEIMHSAGNNEKVTTLSLKLYKMPSYAYFNNVCRVLRARGQGFYNTVVESDESKSTKLGFDEVKAAMEKTFVALGLEDWSVEQSVKALDATLKVALKEKKIYLGPNVLRTPLSLRKAIVHEIFTHVLRHVNGWYSGVYALSKANLISYQYVEEGLAKYNEEKFNVLLDKDILDSAVKAYAIYLAPKMSFRQLYNVVHGFVPKNTAFKHVFKIKRGLGDTSIPGVFMKDVVYFKGFRRVRKKLFEDISLYKKLYAGKISFAQVRWVEEGVINYPKYFYTEEEFRKILDEVVPIK